MVPPSGPVPARIMIVGEAPGEQEVHQRAPFVGSSGMELNRMLHEAGISRTECFLTNVARVRPPDNKIEHFIAKAKKDVTPSHRWIAGKAVLAPVYEGLELLRREVALVQPNVIIAFGNTSLWATTEKWGIKQWRGSTLRCTLSRDEALPPIVIPAYHPAYVLRDWPQRAITVQDLRRARKASPSREVIAPDYKFIIRPNFEDTCAYLSGLLSRLSQSPCCLSVDIETRAGHIACLGIATSGVEAFCIPFMCVENKAGYWSEDEEVFIIALLKLVLCHPNARVVGQNFIYDSQYIFRHWGFVPKMASDTMLGHHACFSTLPKGLDFLSSMYCDFHVYWKDDGKNWDPKVGEDQLWAYNCTDCVRTYEANEAIARTGAKLGLSAVQQRQYRKFWPVLQMMLRGVRISVDERKQLSGELEVAIRERNDYLAFVCDQPLNPQSPKQMKGFFYDDLQLPKIISRKTKKPTLDDDALDKLAKRHPILGPIFKVIREQRSMRVFRSTFLEAKLGHDGRLRCSYNIAGTGTYRFSSSEDAFESGGNLQNIPLGDEAVGLPNVRKLFIPEPGYTMFDVDLDRADLQVVVWEADDKDLKTALRMGVDMHLFSARDIYNVDIPVDELVETHPNYEEHKRRHAKPRKNCKAGVHATNYFCQPRTLAATLGISVREAERFQNTWFGAHPGIKDWQTRTGEQLRGRRWIENRFGYRWYCFERPEGMLPEALAWVPQSTVGEVINELMCLIYEQEPEIWVLLQVHDSLVGEFPTEKTDHYSARIKALASSIIVPYDDPLTIPASCHTSPISWGHCK